MRNLKYINRLYDFSLVYRYFKVRNKVKSAKGKLTNGNKIKQKRRAWTEKVEALADNKDKHTFTVSNLQEIFFHSFVIKPTIY